MQGNERLPPERYPAWVRFAQMGGASTRNRMLIYFAAMVALTAVIILMATGGRLHWVVFAVVSVALTALMVAAIWWIDRHGTWPS